MIDPVVTVQRNVEARCRECGRLLIVSVIRGEIPRGATLQANDIPERDLDRLICGDCARLSRTVVIRDLDDLERSSLGHAACPFCGAVDLQEGPHGGLAINWSCGSCGAAFNLGPYRDGYGFFPAELIREPRWRRVDV